MQLLVNLKDHSNTFLDAYRSGKDLKKKVELEDNWQKKKSGKHIFRGLKFPKVKRKKTPDGDSSGAEEEGGGGRKKDTTSQLCKSITLITN